MIDLPFGIAVDPFQAGLPEADRTLHADRGEEVSGMDATDSGLATMMLEERPAEVVQDLKRRVHVLEEQIAALGGDVADLKRQNSALEKDRGELLALLEAWQAHA